VFQQVILTEASKTLTSLTPPSPATFARTKTLGFIIGLLIDIPLTQTLTNKLVGEPDFRPALSTGTLGIKKNSVAYVLDRV
jgi:hypothetical protein